LRHTFITRAIQAGVPFDEVMKCAGHTVAQTTWRYFNLDNAALQRIAGALEGAKAGASLQLAVSNG
jgi:integrase